MESLFSRRQFTGFGPRSLYRPSDPPALQEVRARRTSRLKAAVRAEVERRPGVYGMVDPRGELIYVGKAKCLRSRLLSYFRPNSRDDKAGRIVRHARRVVWEYAPSEFAALLRELELIRRWRPRFNVHGQPHRRRRTFVCVGRRPAPYVFLSARPAGHLVACFGPVHSGADAREAVRRLNDWYRLRDCPHRQPMVFSDQQELFPMLRAAGCLRYEIGTCSGPCAAACTRDDYGGQVRAALAFLAGADATPLDVLEAEMKAAPAQLAFERAAALLEKRQALVWLSEQLARLRASREGCSFVYPVTGVDGEETWYLLREGQVRLALPAPRDEATRQTAARAVEMVYHGRRLEWQFTTLEEIDGLLLASAWFRKFADERGRGLTPDEALARCRGAMVGAGCISPGLPGPPSPDCSG